MIILFVSPKSEKNVLTAVIRAHKKKRLAFLPKVRMRNTPDWDGKHTRVITFLEKFET